MIYKRELETIARYLRETSEGRPTGGTDRERQAWHNGFREAVGSVADALYLEMGLDANGNRRFRRERFLAAVGVENDEEEER